jgi:hypothetical protein
MRFALFRGKVSDSIDSGSSHSTTSLPAGHTDMDQPRSYQHLLGFLGIDKAYRHTDNEGRLKLSLLIQPH